MAAALNQILSQIYIQFTFQLGSCLLVFLIGKERRPHFAVRLLCGFALFTCLDVLLSLWMYPILVSRLLYAVCYYPLVSLLFYLLILFCYDVSPLEDLILVTGGYATEHIAFAIGRIIQYALGLLSPEASDATSASLPLTLVFRYSIYLPVAFLIYFLIVRRNQPQDASPFNLQQRANVRIIMISVVALMVAIILSVFYSQSFTSPEALFLGNVICPLYSCTCCLLILLMQYDIIRENRLEEEKKSSNQLLQMARTQQLSSKEAIDIINIKCHDLKHQIRQLNRMADAGERSRYVKEINDAINIYDATYHTGCESLDYVLREKALLAQENNIAFSCIADGQTINYMDPPDIYALMGNALDNALEHEKKEPENERSISLSIQRKGQMVLIHLENYCSTTPVFRDGLPQTDKHDKNQHGFGVRSIRLIAHKYGGETQMAVRNNNFILNIILPAEAATA